MTWFTCAVCTNHIWDARPSLPLSIKSMLSVEIERSHSYNNNSSHITGTASIRIFYVISIAANSISRSRKKQQASYNINKKTVNFFDGIGSRHTPHTNLIYFVAAFIKRKEQGIQSATVTITSANLFNV